MKVASVQMAAGLDKQANLDKILFYLTIAKENRADLVLFPEIAMARVPSDGSINHATIAEPLDGPFVTALARAAKSHGLHVVCGLYESKEGERKRAYNSVVLLDDTGTLIHSYRKTHLYDAFSYHESANIIPGDTGLFSVRTKLGMIGILICYELRFPEISRTLALQKADILLVPTAWVSGPLKEEHLFTLAQTRAIENTVFVCIANQTGHIYTGRSMIYDPMGVIMASIGDGEGIIFADLDLDSLSGLRTKSPFLKHRLPMLYQL